MKLKFNFYFIFKFKKCLINAEKFIKYKWYHVK